MKADDKRRFNKGSKEFQANTGSFVDPEKQLPAAYKGAAVQKANAINRRRVKDNQAFLQDAVQSVIDKDPDVLEEILANVAKHAKGDDRVAMSAASIFMEYSGMKAPKQQEVKVVEKVESMEEVEKQLKAFGVELVVDNVKEEGKEDG